MAKGYGEIMAASYGRWRNSKLTSVPACPLCGEPMEVDIASCGFCYNGRTEHSAWLESRAEAAYEYQRQGGVLRFVDLKTPPAKRHENWDPLMQGVIMAVAESPSGETVYFATVRGQNGRTNFRVDIPESGWIPGPEDWVWAPWTERRTR